MNFNYSKFRSLSLDTYLNHLIIVYLFLVICVPNVELNYNFHLYDTVILIIIPLYFCHFFFRIWENNNLFMSSFILLMSLYGVSIYILWGFKVPIVWLMYGKLISYCIIGNFIYAHFTELKERLLKLYWIATGLNAGFLAVQLAFGYSGYYGLATINSVYPVQSSTMALAGAIITGAIIHNKKTSTIYFLPLILFCFLAAGTQSRATTITAIFLVAALAAYLVLHHKQPVRVWLAAFTLLIAGLAGYFGGVFYTTEQYKASFASDFRYFQSAPMVAQEYWGNTAVFLMGDRNKTSEAESSSIHKPVSPKQHSNGSGWPSFEFRTNERFGFSVILNDGLERLRSVLNRSKNMSFDPNTNRQKLDSDMLAHYSLAGVVGIGVYFVALLTTLFRFGFWVGGGLAGSIFCLGLPHEVSFLTTTGTLFAIAFGILFAVNTSSSRAHP